MRTPEGWNRQLHPDPEAWTLEEARRHVAGDVGSLTSPVGEAERPPAPTAEIPAGFDASGEPWSRKAWEILMQRATTRRTALWEAFTTKRASLRAWPTSEPLFRRPEDREFDQFQMTGLHLMEPLRVLGESADGAWLWVESRICAGWIEANLVARATRDQWKTWLSPDPQRLYVITGKGVETEAQPYDPGVSRIPLEFGAYLPLWDGDTGFGRQSPVGHTTIGVPVRTEDGVLDIRPALVKSDGRVHHGYLPYRRDRAVRAIFSQLGDRYDWGDRLGNHDCSSLVMDTYRTVGLQIPRNSGAQRRSLATRIEWEEAVSLEDRVKDLDRARTGDLLGMPGHIMFYLGKAGGVPYAIHAFVGYADGTVDAFDPVLVNAVDVSSLTALTRRGKPYLNAVTKVCRMF